MDEHSHEEQSTQRTGLNRLLSSLYQPGPLIFLFSVAFIGLVALGWHLLTEEPPPPAIISPVAEREESKPSPETRVYEEDTSSEMEDLVKQADLSIIEAMKSVGMGMNELDLLDVEIRTLEGRGYHYQVLQLPAVSDQNMFHKQLQAYLAHRLPEARLGTVNKSELAVFINNLQTHRLLLETVPLTIAKPQPKGPKLAIVIDDIGENTTVLKGLLKLDFPVTLAVWPNATNTRKSVDLITKSHHDLIIHFPMEPRGYPRYNPGDDALFTKMTQDEITSRVAENVAKIPEAIGVNNHMGSRFTADTPGMQAALAEFKRHGLFFLDSLTTGKSVGRSVAKDTGIPFYIRDIFIDNVKDVNAIIHQIKKAENVAKKQGYSIAIGHPYRETLAALQQWGASRNTTIQLIPLSELTPQ